MTESRGYAYTMAHYCKNCQSPPSIILQKAIEFFGPDGLGLQVKEEIQEKTECSASLKARNGHIYVKACEIEKGSEIEVETRDWDEHVTQFLEKV